MIKLSNDLTHMSYEEALKVYNEHAAATGFDLKEHGDPISVNELLHVMKIEDIYKALDLEPRYDETGDLIGWVCPLENPIKSSE